jgi:hypothetical protein
MKGSTIGRITVAVIIIGLVLFWIFVFVISKPINDTLPDHNWGPAAEAVCTDVVNQLHAANLVDVVAKTPQERADLVERQDAILATQVARLRAIPTTDVTTRNATTAWLNDWDTWLRDRAAWLVKLRNGEDAPFLETQDKNGTPSSEALGTFAQINKMPDCATPVGV